MTPTSVTPNPSDGGGGAHHADLVRMAAEPGADQLSPAA